MHSGASINIPMKVWLPIVFNSRVRGSARDRVDMQAVYNHVLRLDLHTLQWTLVDNYGDIPGVRMGNHTDTTDLWYALAETQVRSYRLPLAGFEASGLRR